MALVGPGLRSSGRAAEPGLPARARDIYPSNSRWSLGTALELATAMASTLAHLHGRGVLHGDFYGHTHPA